MRKKIFHKETQKEAIEDLKEFLELGNRKIYQIVTKVSSSGMSRYIKNMVCVKGEIVLIDHLICKILSHVSYSEKGVFIEGCGMDMGFSIAYAIGRALYPNGDGKTVTGRNGDTTPETDGGYLVKSVWL